jgi:hypothetical protein
MPVYFIFFKRIYTRKGDFMKEKDQMSATQANMEMNERFYGKDEPEQDSEAPTYLQAGGTPAIKITGDDE